MITSRIPERTEKLPRLAYDAFEMIARVEDMIKEAVTPIEKELPRIHSKIDDTTAEHAKTREKLDKFKADIEKLD